MGVPVRDRGPEMLGTVGLFLALSTITVLLRTYCRVFLVKNFGLDDCFAVIAWVLFLLYCAFAILGVYNGTGQHSWNLPPEILPVGLKWWWCCEPVYITAMMATKASICVFLLRIAVKAVHKSIIWTVLAVHQLYSVFFFFIFVFQCQPAQYFWTRWTGAKGSCLNPQIAVDTLYAFSAISCAGDWILGILPIFIVWSLQMNTRTKMSVAVILAVGAVASSATIVRIPYIHAMSNQADFLYATTDVAIWSTVELGIGISAMCAATLRPMFRVMLGSSQYGSRTGRSGRATQPWGTPADRPSGYIRSHGVDDGFMLRGDIGKDGGTTTTVRAGDEESFQHAYTSRGKDSIDKLRQDSDSDEWRITKTTKTIQSRE